ncbi:hypothetical protein HPX95_19745 [Bacillus tequilensis]|uniref:hypothetical protein n=1 Tax=Bacillus tequilensis TaxID=227866 RepID=UPI001575B973|nr:hypothetical protein [Bacillus tequilensis]NTU28373.1 hypothetical protein [Bacillus tequilensis]
MFKERLSRTIAYLIAFLLLVSGGYTFYWIVTLPIIGTAILTACVGAFIFCLCAVVIEFINWLIVEPYRNHKRLEADVKRETEGPVE